jgi:hypothetical protein
VLEIDSGFTDGFSLVIRALFETSGLRLGVGCPWNFAIPAVRNNAATKNLIGFIAPILTIGFQFGSLKERKDAISVRGSARASRAGFGASPKPLPLHEEA